MYHLHGNNATYKHQNQDHDSTFGQQTQYPMLSSEMANPLEKCLWTAKQLRSRRRNLCGYTLGRFCGIFERFIIRPLLELVTANITIVNPTWIVSCIHMPVLLTINETHLGTNLPWKRCGDDAERTSLSVTIACFHHRSDNDQPFLTVRRWSVSITINNIISNSLDIWSPPIILYSK